MSDVSSSQDPIQKWLDSLSDQELIAITLLAEARGEDLLGRQMVADVFVNRVKHALEWQTTKGCVFWWGATTREVILKPWQFSCWNPGDPNRATAPGLMKHPLYPEALSIAVAVGMGTLADCANGATHYLNPAAVTSLPPWATPKNRVAQHLHHTFYRVV